jgi:hypothetical protein
VLCYLEALSRDEAARQLGWTPASVKGRLERGRELLCKRLTRRGIAFSAGLLAALEGVPAAASLPSRMVRATLQAAEGPAPAAVADLVDKTAPAVLSGKVKLITGVLAAAACLVGVALIGPTSPPAANESPAPAPARAADPAPAKGAVPVAGRVLDPDGKPVTGAKLAFVLTRAGRMPDKVWATTAADGSFRFTVAPADVDTSHGEDPWGRAIVVAAAEGFGLAMAWPGRAETAAGLTLRLAKDDAPLRGRVLNLQGQPVAGAGVRVETVSEPEKGDLTPWIDATKAGKYEPSMRGAFTPAFANLLPKVVTGEDGSFEVRGVGRERVASLVIDGPTIATRTVSAATRRGIEGLPKTGERAAYAAEFDLYVPPTRPIVGVVRDKDTGKPLAGVRVNSHQMEGRFDHGVRTVTDAEGRFRLVGLPKGKGNEIMAEAHDLPYLTAIKQVEDPIGLDPVTVDFALKRGVWAKGRITDKTTGEPQWAMVEYFCFIDNPNLKQYPRPQHQAVSTAPDGSYRITVLPGRGLIVVMANNDHYVRGTGADKIEGADQQGIYRTHPHFFVRENCHVVGEINPEPGAESVTCDLALDPGRTVTGTVLGPDGVPLAGCRAFGLRGLTYWDHEPLKGAEFKAVAVPAGQARTFQFAHEGKKMIGAVEIGAEESGPLTVKLEPWGEITGRLVSADGVPLSGIDVGAHGTGGNALGRPKTGKDGRFRIEGLIPGKDYGLSAAKGYYGVELPEAVKKGVTAKSGGTTDLGDIRAKPFDQ